MSTVLWDGHSKYQQQDAGCVDGFLEGVGHGGPDTRCDLMPALSSSLGLVSPAPVSLPSGGVQCPRLPHNDKVVTLNACFLLVLARSAQHSQNNVLIVCIVFCCVPSLHQMTRSGPPVRAVTRLQESLAIRHQTGCCLPSCDRRVFKMAIWME